MTACTLEGKKCVPCEGGVSALSPEKVAALLNDIPGWGLMAGDKAIHRRFTFKNFKQALAFTNKVGEIAESEGHHPDILLGWGYVECILTTHAIGNLHENDFIIANKINKLSQ